jgi:hypothetical protein
MLRKLTKKIIARRFLHSAGIMCEMTRPCAAHDFKPAAKPPTLEIAQVSDFIL